MPTESPYTVAIVVDPGFGSRLRDLATTCHVWAVDSPVNAKAAQELRASDGEHSLDKGVTMFRATAGASAEQLCAEIVSTVEEHHGEYSHVPPVGRLRVYGAQLTPDLQAELARYGFTEVTNLTDGFLARSRSAA
jgi:hypothetical protein